MSDSLPRRGQFHLLTRAELAVKEAISACESAGAHSHLTDAVNFLLAAFEKVADYVDQKPRSCRCAEGPPR